MNNTSFSKFSQLLSSKCNVFINDKYDLDVILNQLQVDDLIEVLKLIDDKTLVSEVAYRVSIYNSDCANRMVDFIYDEKYMVDFAFNVYKDERLKRRIKSSRYSYLWAVLFGDNDIMINNVYDSYYAYLWALDIGDRDIMRDRVVDSEWAYEWALNIGDRDIMRDRVVEQEFVYYWALDIGDREIMKYRILDGEWAYEWALNIGDRDFMIHKIKDKNHVFDWICYIGDEEFFKNKFPNYFNCI